MEKDVVIFVLSGLRVNEKPKDENYFNWTFWFRRQIRIVHLGFGKSNTVNVVVISQNSHCFQQPFYAVKIVTLRGK